MAFWNPRASKSAGGDNWHTFQFSALQLLSWWPWQHWLAFWWWTSPGHRSNHCLSVVWRHQDVRDEEETTVGMFLSKAPNLPDFTAFYYFPFVQLFNNNMVLFLPHLFRRGLHSSLLFYFHFVQLFNMVLFLPHLFKRGLHSFLLFISPLFSYLTWSFFPHTCSNRDTSGSNVCHMV